MEYPQKLVNKIIKNIETKSCGRTRYEGQSPFWDEVLVLEIKKLRAKIDYLQKCISELNCSDKIGHKQHDA